jgi:protein gp37
MSRRLKAMGHPNYANGFKPTIHENMLEIPLRWKHPQIIFVNSMSDLFHEEVPLEFIFRMFNVMTKAPQHCFQVLTKRSERLREIAPMLPWPPNVWMGVSVEDSVHKYRIDHLKETGACVKFISFEPLLGPIGDLNLEGIDWVIVGGESGPRARPMDPEWAREIRDKCIKAEVPFFFKQWGGVRRKKNGRLLDGMLWNQMPSYILPNEINK